MTPQRLGQHFLAGPGWRGKILETLPRADGQTWVEIGAGHGEMTQALASFAQRVLAIETDPTLAKGLAARAASNPAEWRGVEVVNADILTLDLAKLAGGPFRVYGNLPYYITSPILRNLFRWADQIESIHVVIQLEVAKRIVARPGRREYGYLSALCQLYATPEIVLRIPAGAFRPPPRVTSALVRLTLPGERASLALDDEQRFLDFIQVCFGHKRKTLRNNLRQFTDEGRIRAAIEACGLRADARAEHLSLPEFAALFKGLR